MIPMVPPNSPEMRLRQVAPMIISDAEQRGQAPGQAGDIVRIPQFVPAHQVKGAAPVTAQPGVIAQEAALGRRGLGRGVLFVHHIHGPGIIAEAFREPGQQMVEEPIAAFKKQGGVFRELLDGIGNRLRVDIDAGLGDRLFHRPGEIGPVHRIVQGKKVPHMGQLGKKIGQDLIEKEQVGLELAGLGLARRCGRRR